MPRLKRLSGAEVIEILADFGFQVHSQKRDRTLKETMRSALTQVIR